jgi:DNA repair protein RecO (recombination protein O)
MRITGQPAYVLHVRAWRETSLLLECLTRDHGRVGLVVRGARGSRARISRAALEPFQPLRIDYAGSGELASLVAAEADGAMPRLAGAGLFSGLYVNELVVRMLARHDPHPGLLERYAATIAALAAGEEPAWTLRRFERDLLASVGYALQLEYDADNGEPLLVDAEYAYVSEHGAVRWNGQRGVRLRGADLLAFAADHRPDAAALPSLRRLLRNEIAAQLGDGGLRSWRVFADVLRTARPR